MEISIHPILDQSTSVISKLWYVLLPPGSGPSPRVGHASILIKSDKFPLGKVYFIGGANPNNAFSNVHILNLEKLQWELCDAPGFHSRYEHAVFVPSSYPHKIYVFGGVDQVGNHNDVQAFDTLTEKWEEIVTLGISPSPRTCRGSASLGDKLIIYSGGHVVSDAVGDRQVYIFDALLNKWSTPHISGNSPKPRQGHSMVAMENQIFLFGGMAGNTFYDDLFILDLEKNKWTEIKTKRGNPPPRAAHGTVIINKQMVVFGGLNKNGPLEDMYLLNLDSFIWNKVDYKGAQPSPRLDFSMSVIGLNMKSSTTTLEGSQQAKQALEKIFNGLTIKDADCSETQEASQIESSLSKEISNCLEFQFILVHGGMDTEGEIYEDCMVLRL